MAHEVTLICSAERSETVGANTAASLFLPLFRMQLLLRAWFHAPLMLKILSADLSEKQHIHHVACLQLWETSFHLQATAMLSAAGNQAEKRVVTSLWSEASTDSDVHAPSLPPPWKQFSQHFLQERQSARSMVSRSLLHLFLLPAPSLLDDLFWRWNCCLRFPHQGLNIHARQWSAVLDTDKRTEYDRNQQKDT